MITLSRSLLEDAARCRKKFYYKHKMGLGTQISSQGASEGTVIHAGLASGFNLLKEQPDSPWSVVKSVAGKAVIDMIDSGTYFYRDEEQHLAEGTKETECVERLVDVVSYYVDNQMPKDMEGAEVISVERDLVYPLDLYYLQGTVDLALKVTLDDGTEVIRVFDHKTVSDSVDKDMKFLDLDIQFLVYEFLANKIFKAGSEKTQVEMVYNLIRRERPPGYGTRELKYNKDGSLSLKNASQDPADYLRQVTIAHNKEEMRYFGIELTTLGMNVIELLDGIFGKYPRTVIQNGSQACGNCEFYRKCAAELVGHGRPDWDFVTKGA